MNRADAHTTRWLPKADAIGTDVAEAKQERRTQDASKI